VGYVLSSQVHVAKKTKLFELNNNIQSTEIQRSDRERKRNFEQLRKCVLNDDSVIAESGAMRKTLLLAHSVAKTESTVIIYGETGTGKEVIANYIYRYSNCAGGAFIAVNCAALPENLVEAELFGYEKGAFTGADPRGKIGLFEAANNGTLFLDEIAELPLAVQSKLLRVLETGCIRRIGSCNDRKINFRLICATHKNLEKMIEARQFRQELFFRLNIFPNTIPPLRERPEDIIVFSQKFLAEFNKKYNTEVTFDQETIQKFIQCSWAGNVRELRNMVERKVISSLNDYNSEYLTLASASFENLMIANEWIRPSGSLREVLKMVEEWYIKRVLRECGGRMGETSKRLGIYRTFLYRKIKSFETKHVNP
jgi:transcriptional regulator with PAS, ATPase and Fis domain